MLTTAPDEVRSLTSLGDEVIDAWQALIVAHGGGYFSGPLWARCWYEQFGASAETRVGVWRDRGEPVAVAAMMRVPERLLPSGALISPSVATWRNLGSGEGGADHLAFAARPDLRSSVVAWASALGSTTRLLNLDATWVDALPTQPSWHRADVRTYQVPIAENGGQPGSKKMWKNIAWGRRRLVDQDVVFGVHVGPEVSDALLRELLRLHAARSDAAGRTTSFTIDRLPFHARLARESNDIHRSVLVTAHQADRLVGGLYGFVDRTTFSYYQSGWSPEFERHSLGSVLLGEAFATARQMGLETFDFLRGDEPYKLRFHAATVHDVSVSHLAGAGGAILGARDRLVERLAARRVPESD